MRKTRKNSKNCELLRCAHKLQTISDAFSHIASRFVKVALAIKFALNWLAGPQCVGGGTPSSVRLTAGRSGVKSRLCRIGDKCRGTAYM